MIDKNKTRTSVNRIDKIKSFKGQYMPRPDDFDEDEKEMFGNMQIYFGIRSRTDLVRYALTLLYNDNEEKILKKVRKMKKK